MLFSRFNEKVFLFLFHFVCCLFVCCFVCFFAQCLPKTYLKPLPACNQPTHKKRKKKEKKKKKRKKTPNKKTETKKHHNNKTKFTNTIQKYKQMRVQCTVHSSYENKIWTMIARLARIRLFLASNVTLWELHCAVTACRVSCTVTVEC